MEVILHIRLFVTSGGVIKDRISLFLTDFRHYFKIWHVFDMIGLVFRIFQYITKKCKFRKIGDLYEELQEYLVDNSKNYNT